MKKIDNYKFYKDSYKEHGATAQGVHWDSEFTQNKRFEILTNFIKNDLENSSLIDVGCGYGAYLTYLKKENLFPNIYLGIDCERFIIDITSKKFDKNVFIKCDILKDEMPKADYLICSGALNILTQIDFLEAIENCFYASSKGFIFNFLTNHSVHNLSTEIIYGFCKKLTKKVTISENYLPNDSTIFLEK
ncbi:class I SAM-dependent methyltransferase [Arcobacter sp. LA11]|uniref:class I SAM-dependent methyltransferase n=1 Tax=Arcobacter sp. LA11 TaxID=1898176 RepID=UPI000934C9E2|nr:class I SAM-dependent methyltransferase [Arcobacter sp. LA11]